MASKPKQPEREAAVRTQTLEDILADRFARYSKYIIQERALPDARDGLKPVQRRILYAMQEAGNLSTRPYHKSAKTVGNVIGNYHPHGDSSVYDAMVRMSQDWKMNFPLVDMQGNNGSIDDDPAAAMRYTEARLAPVAQELLTDIDKDTVEWAPNFSDEKMEPTVLPAAYPNLLVHGISGIAAGYATNIPPHNLEELLDACIELLQHPDTDRLYEIVKGPDFPTGGLVLEPQGIREAFDTGRGRIIIRSVCEIKELRTLNQIVVTEIPYEVVKSQLVKKIDDVRLNKKVSGILDVRDESDRNGLRIVIDLKKEAPASEILNYLYKNTDLQISCNYNVIAIVNKRPVLLSLRAALEAFLAHRREVVRRRSQFDLDKARTRAHILEGLIRAISILDEIIQTIRQSKNKGEAKSRLCLQYAFTDTQAEAIVMMRLYRLSNTDILELQEEYARLEKEISRLEGILASAKKLDNVIVKELKETRKRFPAPRKTKILDQSAQIVIDEAAMIPDEQVMVAVSRDGYLKRSGLRSYTASQELVSGRKEGDIILAQGQVSTRDSLLLFTDRGKTAWLPVYQLEEAKWKDLGTHAGSWLKLEQNEKLAAAVLVKEAAAGIQVILASRKGLIKRTSLDLFMAGRPARLQMAMKVGAMDSLQSVILSENEDDQVLLCTHEGFGQRYWAGQIPQAGLKTKGVKALSLADQDDLQSVSLLKKTDQQVLLLCADGNAKRMHLDQIPELKRPARGNRLFKPVKTRNWQVQAILPVETDEKILLQDGLLEVKEIPFMPAARTFSSPKEALKEPVAVIEKLVSASEGSWPQSQSQIEQLRLFGDGDESANG